ncbi:MAG: hypothetical protein ACLSHJ_03695 [Oscillospiraceae bacterium]
MKDYIAVNGHQGVYTLVTPNGQVAVSRAHRWVRSLRLDSIINNVKEIITMEKENLYLIHGEDYLRHIEEKLESAVDGDHPHALHQKRS